jgi:amino acid transporter
VFYALARNGLAPKPLARTHSRFKTPHVAIIGMSIFALVLALLFGWKWGPLDGFFTIATMAVPVVIIVYMLISVGCMRWYLGPGRSDFNVLLHVILPLGGIVLFFFPLYYQFYKYPPVYPEKYGNWVDIAWVILGLILMIWLLARRPEKLRDMERVYVEDETVAPSLAVETA